MQNKIITRLVSIYKFFINIVRIFLGILIIKFNFDISMGVMKITEIYKNNPIIIHIVACVKGSSYLLTLILATTLIVFSIVEIIFVLGLINRKKWGAVGLFINSFLWIPVEILFVSKFLVASELFILIIDVFILFLLYKLIRTSNFK